MLVLFGWAAARYNPPMSRWFSQEPAPPSPRAVLIAIGITLLLGVGPVAGPSLSACLVELSAAAFGAAIGISAEQTAIFALLAALLAIPFAAMVFVVIEGINC